jgi:hypothetical protein
VEDKHEGLAGALIGLFRYQQAVLFDYPMRTVFSAGHRSLIEL